MLNKSLEGEGGRGDGPRIQMDILDRGRALKKKKKKGGNEVTSVGVERRRRKEF